MMTAKMGTEAAPQGRKQKTALLSVIEEKLKVDLSFLLASANIKGGRGKGGGGGVPQGNLQTGSETVSRSPRQGRLW